jgi:hypothetical protein
MVTRAQQQADGTFAETVDGANFEAPKKTTSEKFGQGAQVNPHPIGVQRVGGPGSPESQESAAERHAQLLSEYNELDQRITLLEEAGQDVPKHLKEKRVTLRVDTAMAYGKSGGDISSLLD